MKVQRIDLDGLLLLNKPSGITSNRALQICKRLLNAKKAGHTGSLDPLATGMLPICFGQATKFSQYLLDANKTYEVTARLGVTTNTGDSDGDVVSSCKVPEFTLDKIQNTLKLFIGDIEQIPPMYSALKYKGKKLYQLARAGIEVERKKRSITIYKIDAVQYQGDVLKCRVACSKGTYIRTFIEDIGKELKCGAHITKLHRTQVADLPTQMIDIAILEEQTHAAEQLLLPSYTLLNAFSEVEVSQEYVNKLLQGQAVPIDINANNLANTTKLVKLFSFGSHGNKRFLGLGEINGNIILPKRLITL